MYLEIKLAKTLEMFPFDDMISLGRFGISVSDYLDIISNSATLRYDSTSVWSLRGRYGLLLDRQEI